MTVPSFWRSRSSRTTLIVLLLLISFATAILLALHANYSDASQRATAESVLRDYSALVADEVVRRSAAEIGYYGYYPLITAVLHEAQQPDGSPPTKMTLLSSSDAGLKRAAGLAKGCFFIDPAGRRTILAQGAQNAAQNDEVSAWLQANVPSLATSGNSAYQVFNTQIAGVPRTFVAASGHSPPGRPRIAGFEVDLAALTPWFAAALGRQPLVPPSLGHGQVSNAFVYIVIRDQAGAERFRMGPDRPPSWAVTRPFGDTYQGIFSGFTVAAAIDPQVARQIVIGGLPPSRWPFFRGVLALNAVLIVTAILQLRREMALQKLRDEFVSSVSHELRTPLTQIRMFAETLLLDRVRSQEERRRSLEIIDREARRLGQLVENVLEFSRSERKAASLSKEERELGPLIQEIVDDFASIVDAGQVGFECRLEGGLIANVDPDAVRQIVINLLDNAVKYGPKQQRIVVGLEARAGQAVIFVDDEGPGIPPSDRKRIFAQFQRLERDRRSAIAGTGIGLSVLKDLVTRHGGKCCVDTGDRGGAKFVVELPLAAPAHDRLREQAELSP
jgi:signal transduction histidine kinase